MPSGIYDAYYHSIMFREKRYRKCSGDLGNSLHYVTNRYMGVIMASKETKKYLNQLRTLQFNIDHKLSELYRLETLAEKTTIAIKNDRVQSSPADKLSDAVVKIVTLKDEIAAIYEDYMVKRQHILSQIESLEDTEHVKVLLLRYDECLPFDAMPERLSMSRRTVFRIYDKAMNAFEKRYGQEYLDTK